MTRLLVRDLAQVATPAGADAPLRGSALGDVRVVEDAYVLCLDGAIESVGRMRDLGRLGDDVAELDGCGRSAVPGLVDCHTHACFAGDRVAEFDLRSSGASYEELHAAGGGILSTVRATRAAGEPALTAALERHRAWMLAHGTTTFEAKSGYGLDRETELAMLRAVRAAGGSPTWLGAHAVPPEFPDADAYLDFALAEVLPEAAKLAEAADVFVERGAFDAAQARRYLEACRDAGLGLRLHADQFTEGGGIGVAVELGARSVDHLEATGSGGVRQLAASAVAAVLLPVAALFLGRPMPPARDLVEAGAVVALATDFNPGSAYCESLPVAMSLGCTQLGLSPAQALTACTVNAAHVLRGAERIGRLEPGYAADVVLVDANDWRNLAYHLAGDLVACVLKSGELVYERGVVPPGAATSAA
ncbi:MAG: imidazolonepropionase [Actinobacteria bacterium]|nr:MAG: imidazolonepropionase [Actinomycetota bacterium]